MEIYVSNLPYSVSDSEVADLFSPYGEVQSAKVVFDRQTGQSRGFAFVKMDDDAAARDAIEALNGQPLQGRRLNVREARPRGEMPDLGKPRGYQPPSRRDSGGRNQGGRRGNW